MNLVRVMVCLFLIGTVVLGVTPSATTAASPAIDLASPRAAVLSVYACLRAGDIPAAQRCLIFADARQADAFDVSMTQLWAPLSVMHAMEARFGEAGRKPFSCASLENTVDQIMESLRVAEIAVTGETAVISEKKAAVDPSAETEVTGITLKRQGEQWRVVAATFPDMTGEIPADQLPMMRTLRNAVANACQTTLARLARGDFKTAEEAFGAYQAQVQQGVRTTAPATRP